MQVSGRTYYLISHRLFWHNVFWAESTAFKWALYRGYASVVEQALDAGAWTNIEYGSFSGPLDVAIYYGYADVVKVLLERDIGFDEDPTWMVSSANGILEIGDKSPLYKALARGHPDVLQVLFSYVKKSQGYDVGKRSRPVRGGWHTYGITVSGAAAEQLMRDVTARGDLDSVKFLAQFLPSLINSEVEGTYGTAPIIQAVRNHRIEVLRFLLKAGVDPGRGVMYREDTPLYHAAQNGSFGAVQLLLDKGARVDPRMAYQQGGRGQSLEILETAVAHGHVKVAEILLKCIKIRSKSKITLRDKDTLIIAAAACGLTGFIREILDHVHKGYLKQQKGERTFLSDIARLKPLTVAIQNGHKDVVSLLIDYGACMKDTFGNSPLIRAISNGHVEVVQLLFDKGAADLSQNDFLTPSNYLPSRQCTHGFAALCHAVPFPSVFQLLLNKGAQPTIRVEKLILVTEVVRLGSEELAQILSKEGILLEAYEEAAGQQVEQLGEQLGEQSGEEEAMQAPEQADDEVVESTAEPTAEQGNKTIGGKAGRKTRKIRSMVQQIGANSQEVKGVMSRALNSGDATMVNYLCYQGCNPNHKWPAHLGGGKATSLEVAAMAADREKVATTLDVLLYRGADVNQLQGDWEAYYSDEKYLTALELLVERGADAAPHTSKWGRKVLALASSKRHRKTTRFLLSESCNQGASYGVVAELIKSCQERLRQGCDLQFEKVLKDAYWRSIYPVPREKIT